ncbi:hypothetical protein M8C21_008059 [Ambrosia artemisiifolia]|uniref:Uncharacterized protein n=1 Tax=Ambrosia artemisiifolia TaxID=4212 RepID=A0AAD5CWP2_AMBAR|nr:hypothetical protein M8C21_008059 [Ambrosia artemisiifolia]
MSSVVVPFPGEGKDKKKEWMSIEGKMMQTISLDNVAARLGDREGALWTEVPVLEFGIDRYKLSNLEQTDLGNYWKLEDTKTHRFLKVRKADAPPMDEDEEMQEEREVVQYVPVQTSRHHNGPQHREMTAEFIARLSRQRPGGWAHWSPADRYMFDEVASMRLEAEDEKERVRAHERERLVFMTLTVLIIKGLAEKGRVDEPRISEQPDGCCGGRGGLCKGRDVGGDVLYLGKDHRKEVPVFHD